MISRRSAIERLVGLAVALAATACASEERSLPEHYAVFVTEQGGMIPRYAESMDQVAPLIEFSIAPVPVELGGLPLILVEGIVNPPFSRVHFNYGPPEVLNTPGAPGVKFHLAQSAGPRSPRDPAPNTEVAGVPAFRGGWPGNPTLHWEACGVHFFLGASGASDDEAFGAAEAITRFCSET